MVIAALLGHADFSTSAKYYIKLSEGELRNEFERAMVWWLWLINESLDERNVYYDYKNHITITISAEVLSSIGFKQIHNVLITPSKEGYNLIGYNIISETYRIAPICISLSPKGYSCSLSIYVTDTYNSDSIVTAVPIYIENK